MFSEMRRIRGMFGGVATRKIAVASAGACAGGLAYSKRQAPSARCDVNEALLGVAAGALSGYGLHALLSSKNQVPQVTPNQWYFNWYVGFRKLPGGGEKRDVLIGEYTGYAKMLCIAISGDGEPSKTEVEFVQGLISTMVPVELRNQIVSNVPLWAKAYVGKSQADIKTEVRELMKVGHLSLAGKSIIFDAYRAAASDGLASGEEAAIGAEAKALGVSKTDARKCKDLAMEEMALTKKRVSHLYPKHPLLKPEFATL
eukprot:TRINITY_DN57719_c0_g1_i1.p1 TRINITY_DN57719_c0_g1~~TRINITY_DN57719_c0_g1_i1.p1  ORF type:complete len:257 (+),score=33.82 TRINITY_DN57719_c0_g1_i1:22-792(+)